jgi:hypothetical protein
VQGLRGGCYVNEAPASGPTETEGVYVQCNNMQDVNKSDGKDGCKAVSITADSTVKSCWKCKDQSDMMNCLRGNGACE